MSDLTYFQIRPGNFFLGRQQASDPYLPVIVVENLRRSVFVKACNQPMKEPFGIIIGQNPKTGRPFSDYFLPMPLTYDALRDFRLTTSQQQEKVAWLKLPDEFKDTGSALLVRYDISKQQPPALYSAPQGRSADAVETAHHLTDLDGVHHLQNLILDLTGINLESLTMR